MRDKWKSIYYISLSFFMIAQFNRYFASHEMGWFSLACGFYILFSFGLMMYAENQ